MLQQTEPEPGTEGQNGAGVQLANGGALVPTSAAALAHAAAAQAADIAAGKGQPKRLHVSNIPFRFRDPDLRTMFGVSDFFFY